MRSILGVVLLVVTMAGCDPMDNPGIGTSPSVGAWCDWVTRCNPDVTFDACEADIGPALQVAEQIGDPLVSAACLDGLAVAQCGTYPAECTAGSGI